MSTKRLAPTGATSGDAPRPLYQWLLVAGVVALLLLRASDTFISDHATGDQRSYLSLAMKLDRSGFGGYDLYHVSREDIAGGLEYVWSHDANGELLEAYRDEGIGFFGQPVFHAPPLLPALLCLSHRVLAPRIGYRVLYPEPARRMRLDQRLDTQLYSSVVPLLFGLILVLATFLLGRVIFGYWTGLIAALLIAISPAVVFASERLWQDVPLAALVALTMWLLLRHLESDDLGSLVLAAVCYSLALLMKTTAALLAPTIVFAMAQRAREKRVRRPLAALGARLVLFFLLCVILTFPWFHTAWRTWGTPFYNAGEEGISGVHSWWIFLKGRPWYTYLLSIPVMVPLYLLGFSRIATLPRSSGRRWEWLLAVWFLSLLAMMTVMTRLSEQLGPDSRYMLLAYPPLAILTAAEILRIHVLLAKRAPATIARWAIIGSLLLCSAWSYRLTDVHYAQFPRIYHNFLNLPF